MKLSIIIPTYNREMILKDTLCHLYEAVKDLEAEIVIINDSKTQKVILGEHPENVKLLDNPSSGAASARNLGAKNASGDLLLFIDDDIIISKHNLEHTLLLHSTYKNSCFNLNWKFTNEMMVDLQKNSFGRFMLHVKLTDYQGWVPELNWEEKKLFPVQKLAAFYFSIEKKVFEASGGFDESFKNQSVEDDELSKRLVKNNVKLFVDPEEYVFHNESDKTNLISRLNRLKAGAYNKRQAFEMGMKDYEIQYSGFKIFIYSVLNFFRKPIITLTRIIPNAKWSDPLYRSLVHLLIGTVIFDGYYKRNITFL